MKAGKAALGAAMAMMLCAVPAQASVTLTPISTPFNQFVGIDYHEPTNKLVVSVNYPSGNPYNFQLVAQDGGRAQYGPTHGLTDELKIATVRSGPCRGGFSVGDTFAGTGVPGEILRISPDGTTVQDPWVTLSGETGLMRGSLFQDRYCAAGGDLIAVTTAGNVWRITSAGVATKLATTGVHLEGLQTFPNDPARYGTWAGKIVAGAEGQARFYVINPAGGGFTIQTVNGIQPEDIDIIPAHENFFGVNYGSGRLYGAEAAQFTSMVGDVLVTEESSGKLYRLHWNGAAWTSETLADLTSTWEHVTFAPNGVVEIPPANRPPNADAGPDQTVAQTSPAGASVTLDGTGSSDPDAGDTLTYAWSDGSTGATPTVTAPVGTTTYTLTVTDESGAMDTDSVDITVTADGSDPTISGSRSPAANANGWNNSPVSVHFDCADPQSGITSCTADTVLSGEGAGQSVTGTAVNGAGRTASATVGNINIDLTKPIVGFSGNAVTYGVDDQVTIACSATDALSGIAAQSCPSVNAPAYSLGSGSHTLSASATDKAGNGNAASTTYTIVVTTDDLCALVDQFVDQHGVAHSMCVKIKKGNMEPFRNEVRAQTGKHGLTQSEANILIALSREL